LARSPRSSPLELVLPRRVRLAVIEQPRDVLDPEAHSAARDELDSAKATALAEPIERRGRDAEEVGCLLSTQERSRCYIDRHNTA
jgi:hypothetical protein